MWGGGRQVGESFSQSWRHFLTPKVSHTTRGAPGWLRRYELRAVYLCVLAGDTCNQIDTKTGTHQPLPPRHLAPRWASPKGFEDGDDNFGRTFAYPHVASRVNSAWLHVCVCVCVCPCKVNSFSRKDFIILITWQAEFFRTTQKRNSGIRCYCFVGDPKAINEWVYVAWDARTSPSLLACNVL